MKTVVISERKIRAIIDTLDLLGLKSLTKELHKALRFDAHSEAKK